MKPFLPFEQTSLAEGDCDCCPDGGGGDDCCVDTQCDIIGYVLIGDAYIDGSPQGDVIVPIRRIGSVLSYYHTACGYGYKASDGTVAWLYQSGSGIQCISGVVSLRIEISLSCGFRSTTEDYDCSPVGATFDDFDFFEGVGCHELTFSTVEFITGPPPVEPARFTDPIFTFFHTPDDSPLIAISINAVSAISNCADCPCIADLSFTLGSPEGSAPYGDTWDIVDDVDIGCAATVDTGTEFTFDGTSVDLTIAVTGGAGGDFTIEFNQIVAAATSGVLLLCDIVGGSCDGEQVLVAVTWT